MQDTSAEAARPLLALAVIGMAHFWWVLLLRGALVFSFGVFCLARPDATGLLLVRVFGAWMVLEATCSLLKLYGHQRANRKGDLRLGYVPPVLYFLSACCALGIGIYAFSNPDAANTAYMSLVGAFFFVGGFLELFLAAVIWKDENDDDGLTCFFGTWGALSVLYGILAFANPNLAQLPHMISLGVMSLFTGSLSVYLSVKLRRLNRMLWSTERAEGEAETIPVSHDIT